MDDQIINRIILKEFANMHNLKSDEAENGKIAVQMYKDSLLNAWCNGYKLILMDLNMPVMDGLTATQRIFQEKWKWPKPIIIAITAFCTEEEKKKWFKVGMSDFKLKPIDMMTFKKMVTDEK